MDKLIVEEVADFAAVEDLLDTLDDVEFVEEVETEIEEPVVEEEILAAEDVAALEADMAKAELYEEAAVGPSVEEPEVVATATPAKVAKTKSPKGPKVVRDLAALPVDTFILRDDFSVDPSRREDHKTAMIAARPTQIKVAEKFDNLFVSIASGRTPNVYTTKAFQALLEKSVMSTGELVAHFKAVGYKEGTARSQAGQIMALFPVVGIATRSSGKLTLNEDSTVAAKLIALPGVV